MHLFQSKEFKKLNKVCTILLKFHLFKEPYSILSQNYVLPKKVFIFEDLSLLISHRPWCLVSPSQAALDVKPFLQGCVGEEDGVHDDKEDCLAANLNIVDAENFDN